MSVRNTAYVNQKVLIVSGGHQAVRNSWSRICICVLPAHMVGVKMGPVIPLTYHNIFQKLSEVS